MIAKATSRPITIRKPSLLSLSVVRKISTRDQPTRSLYCPLSLFLHQPLHKNGVFHHEKWNVFSTSEDEALPN